MVITQALSLMGNLQFGIRQSAELENQMTSVERILEYTNIPQEAPLESSPGNIIRIVLLDNVENDYVAIAVSR